MFVAGPLVCDFSGDGRSCDDVSVRTLAVELPASDRRQLEDAIRRYKKLMEAESQKTREARAAHLAGE